MPPRKAVCQLALFPTIVPERTPVVTSEQVLEIYAAYPKHVARGSALVAIQKALKKIPFDELLPIVQAYAKARTGQERQFTPLPTTWFNQERWADDPVEWIRSNGNGNGNVDARRAYGILCAEVRRCGIDTVPAYPDKNSFHAVRRMGGWRAFCDWRTSELRLRQQQFLEAYES